MSNLISLLPDRYANSAEIVAFQNAFGKWVDALADAREDLFLQIHVSTATWGLDAWERALGIETDTTRPIAQRRSKIESQLRGLGVTTKAMIKNVAESFSNGQVEIVEFNNEYRFEVRFTGSTGMPPSVRDLMTAIERIKPAHLNVLYVYTFQTWSAVKNKRWSDVKLTTWAELKNQP